MLATIFEAQFCRKINKIYLFDDVKSTLAILDRRFFVYQTTCSHFETERYELTHRVIHFCSFSLYKHS